MPVLGLLYDYKFWSQLGDFDCVSSEWIECFLDFMLLVFSCLMTTSRTSRRVVKMCCLSLELWEKACRFTTEYDVSYRVFVDVLY